MRRRLHSRGIAHHQRRLLPVGLSLLGLVIGCPPPEAEPIQGDIGSAIEKGISEGTSTFDHGVWDGIVRNYTREGGRKFDYAGLKREEAKLNAYLARLAEVDLSSLLENDLFALFINAYNAYTVKTVLETVSEGGTHEVASIRDIPDVFDRTRHVVGGHRLSLNNIEHNILRPFFKDPRIHFAVNCASTSCPPLPARAFTGEAIDQQLEEVTRNVLSSPDYVRVENDQLLVTKIMEWYGSDFTNQAYQGAEETLPSYIRKYTREEVRRWINSRSTPPGVSFMSYDWSLNDA